jgi:dimethylglycine catabolism A
VIVATGAIARRPADVIPGADRHPVFDVREVLDGAQPPGRRVLVFDDVGDRSALSAAEYLVERGHEVTFATSMTFPGQGLDETVRGPTVSRLARAGTTFVSSVQLSSVHDDGVDMTDLLGGAVRVHADQDALVTALVPVADDTLFAELRAAAIPATLVGDALAPRNVTDATHDGHVAARALGSLA